MSDDGLALAAERVKRADRALRSAEVERDRTWQAYEDADARRDRLRVELREAREVLNDVASGRLAVGGTIELTTFRDLTATADAEG